MENLNKLEFDVNSLNSSLSVLKSSSLYNFDNFKNMSEEDIEKSFSDIVNYLDDCLLKTENIISDIDSIRKF